MELSERLRLLQRACDGLKPSSVALSHVTTSVAALLTFGLVNGMSINRLIDGRESLSFVAGVGVACLLGWMFGRKALSEFREVSNIIHNYLEDDRHA